MTLLQPHSPQHTMTTKNSVPTLIAVDGSGSTGGNRFYHAQTQRIVADVLAHKSNVTIIRWDDSTTTVTRSELQTWNANCSGGCGTSPHVIASYVKATHFKGDLVLITDGETPAEYIDMVASEMPTSNPFTHVITHLIPTGGVVNQSISCPFTRSCPYEVREYDRAAGGEGRTTVEVTATELAILGHLDSIQTIDDFLAAFPTIEKVVVAATMGSVGDPRLRDTLLALKKRIQRVDAVVKGESAFAVALEAALTPGPQQDRAAALVAARALVGEYYAPIAGSEEDPDAPTWSARIARLVSMTEGALRYSFDLSGFSAAIRGDRVRRATKVRVAPVENVPVQDQEGVAAFECPILCDNRIGHCALDYRRKADSGGIGPSTDQSVDGLSAESAADARTGCGASRAPGPSAEFAGVSGRACCVCVCADDGLADYTPPFARSRPKRPVSWIISRPQSSHGMDSCSTLYGW